MASQRITFSRPEEISAKLKRRRGLTRSRHRQFLLALRNRATTPQAVALVDQRLKQLLEAGEAVTARNLDFKNEFRTYRGGLAADRTTMWRAWWAKNQQALEKKLARGDILEAFTLLTGAERVARTKSMKSLVAEEWLELFERGMALGFEFGPYDLKLNEALVRSVALAENAENFELADRIMKKHSKELTTPVDEWVFQRSTAWKNLVGRRLKGAKMMLEGISKKGIIRRDFGKLCGLWLELAEAYQKTRNPGLVNYCWIAARNMAIRSQNEKNFEMVERLRKPWEIDLKKI